MKYQIRPGNSSVLVNGRVRGEASGCPRAILIRAYWGQPKVVDRRSLITFAIGSACEKVVADELALTSEYPVKFDVEMSEEITEETSVVGHADIVWKKPDKFVIGEHKSVQSTNSFKKYIEKGQPKITNALQACNYAVIAETDEAKLIYTACLYDKGVKAGDQRTYDIRLHDSGVITCDQETLPFTVNDIVEWRLFIADCLENKRIEAAPEPWDFSTFSVCSGCDYEKCCEAYNNDGSFELFEREVKGLLGERGVR